MIWKAARFRSLRCRCRRNELRSRIQMTDVVNRRKIRHAHMVNINRQIMLEGMRADFQRVDRLSQKVVEMVRKASKIRAKTAAGHRSDGRSESQLQVAEDQRHYLSGEVGKPAGRRNLHDAGRSEWDVRDRWRGRRLSVREVWRLEGDSAHDQHEGQSPGRGALGKSRTARAISGSTRTPTRTATAWASLRLGPTLI